MARGKSYIPQEFDKPMRIAFDVNVSNSCIGAYARDGNIVVCCALEAESDESFLSRAFVAGAEVVMSQDADIGLIIDREGYDMIWRRYVGR